MSKIVNFYLGPALGLTSRTVTITRMYRAGDDAPPAAAYGPTNVGGSATTLSVSLDDNVIYQAKLIDVLTGGGTSAPDILNFHTGDLQFPGPRSDDRLQILSMEDESSASSSNSSTSSSSSASSSTSSSISTSSLSTSSSLSSSSPSSSSSHSDSSLSSSSPSSSSSHSTSTSSSSSQSSESSSSEGV